VLVMEARVTMVDAYLAGSVLIGLLLNTLLGWWWADPLAGLVIVFTDSRRGDTLGPKALSRAVLQTLVSRIISSSRLIDNILKDTIREA